VNAFHYCGIVLAVWALIVTFLGVTRESFPASSGAERLTTAISVVLVLAAIASGIYAAANEEHDGAEEEQAWLLTTTA
jgi:hypothetical protein